jgi:hypothetical protein
MNLKKSFSKHCEDNQYELNFSQIEIIDDLIDYHKNNFNQSFLKRLFQKKIVNLDII